MLYILNTRPWSGQNWMVSSLRGKVEYTRCGLLASRLQLLPGQGKHHRRTITVKRKKLDLSNHVICKFSGARELYGEITVGERPHCYCVWSTREGKTISVDQLKVVYLLQTFKGKSSPYNFWKTHICFRSFISTKRWLQIVLF